ncbi:MAG: hypothetical protein A2Z96_01025 [Spirochaetes bacterium GWB1_48_6]|nr:MAG: hypothetical protein A2Z96_01025 [Spirochaetes bacterium GWB1_48_6]
MNEELRSPRPHLRPREKIKQLGPEGLSDQELMALILSSGCAQASIEDLAPACLAVLDKHQGLEAYKKLIQIKGIGHSKAGQIVGTLELTRRIYLPHRPKIRLPQDAYTILRRYADRPQEHFLCLSLNGAHEVLRTRLLTIGLLNRTLIHPREVFAGPIKDRSAGVIVAHSHPSGNLDPSREDRDITRRIWEAGQILGIPLLDHLIFTQTSFYSFQESGLLC